MNSSGAKNLFPVFEVPSVTADDKPTGQRYYPSPLWDYEAGDFAVNGARQVIYGSGYEAWVQWCIKTIMTERWAHRGYSSNAGIEAMGAFGLSNRKAQESALRRTITEALLADPMGRARQVRNFRFNRQNDSLHISCEVYGLNGNSATISAVLSG